MAASGEGEAVMADAKPPPLVHLFALSGTDNEERDGLPSSLQDTPVTQCIAPSAASLFSATDFVLPTDSSPARRATRDDSWALLVSEHISRRFTFRQTTISVGRGADCDVVLRDLRVSVHHFTIYLEREVHVARATAAPGETPSQGSETRAPRRGGGCGRRKDGGRGTVSRAFGRRRRGGNKNGQPATSHLSSPSYSPPPPSSPPAPQGVIGEAERTAQNGDVAGGGEEHCNASETWTTLRVMLEDHSTNGTYVNDVRVGKGRRCELKSGDDIAIVPLPEKRTRDESDEVSDDLGGAEATVAEARHGAKGCGADDRLRQTRPLAAWIDTVPEGRTYLEHFCLHLYPKESRTSPAAGGQTGSASAPSLPRAAGELPVRHGDAAVSLEDVTRGAPRQSPGLSLLTGPPSRLVPPATTSAASRQPPLPVSPIPERDDGGAAGAARAVVPLTSSSSSPLRVSVSSQLTGGSQAGRQLVADICAGFIAPQWTAATPRASPSVSSVARATPPPRLTPHTMLSPVGYTVTPRRQLQWGPCVGSGTSGRVYLGIDIASSKLIAIKVLRHTCPSSRASSKGEVEDAGPHGVSRHTQAQPDSANHPRRSTEDDDEESTILSLSDVSLDHTRPPHETDELQAAVFDKEHTDGKMAAGPQRRQDGGDSGDGASDNELEARFALVGQHESGGQDGVVNVSVSLKRAYLRELWFLTQLQNHRIVRCLGFQQEADKGLCILMEYVAGGTLQSLIKSFGAFEENVIRLYTVQILEGLEYLHGCCVVHGDLKSANVLVSERGNVKLTDFGTSRLLRDFRVDNARCPRCHRLIATGGGTVSERLSSPSTPPSPSSSSDPSRADAQPISYCHCAREPLGGVAAQAPAVLCGTPLYMSPELIRTQLSTFASDVWALGCIVFEMATGGVLPWREVHHLDVCSILFHIGNQTTRGPSFADVYAARAGLAMSEPRRPTSAPTLDEEGDGGATGEGQAEPYTGLGVTAACGRALPQSASAPGTPASLSTPSSRASDGAQTTRTPSAALIDFLRCMLNVDAAQRPRVSDLLMHPFILNEPSKEAMERWYTHVGLRPPPHRAHSASCDAEEPKFDTCFTTTSPHPCDVASASSAHPTGAALAVSEALWQLPTPTVVPVASSFAACDQGAEGGARTEGGTLGIEAARQRGQSDAVSQESQPLIVMPRKSCSSQASSAVAVAPPSLQGRRDAGSDAPRLQARPAAVHSYRTLAPLSLPTCHRDRAFITTVRRDEDGVAPLGSQPSTRGQGCPARGHAFSHAYGSGQNAGVSYRSSVLRSHQHYLRAQERQRRRRQQQQQQQQHLHFALNSSATIASPRRGGRSHGWHAMPYSPSHHPITPGTCADSVLHENAIPHQYALPTCASGAVLAASDGVLGDIPPTLSAPAFPQAAPLCRGGIPTLQTSQHPPYIVPAMGTMTLMMDHVSLSEGACQPASSAMPCCQRTTSSFGAKPASVGAPPRHSPREPSYPAQPATSQSRTPPSTDHLWTARTAFSGPPRHAPDAVYYTLMSCGAQVTAPPLSSTASASSAVPMPSCAASTSRCYVLRQQQQQQQQQQPFVAARYEVMAGGGRGQQTAPQGAEVVIGDDEDRGGGPRRVRRLEANESVPAVVVGGRRAPSMGPTPVFPAAPRRCPSPGVSRVAEYSASMTGQEKAGVLGAADDRRLTRRAAPAVASGEGEKRLGSDGQLDKLLEPRARHGVRGGKPRVTSWRVRGRCADRRAAKKGSRSGSGAKR